MNIGALEHIFECKTARILDAYNRGNGLTIEELASITHISKRTAWRINTRLRRQGIIAVVDNRGHRFVYALNDSQKAHNIRALAAVAGAVMQR